MLPLKGLHVLNTLKYVKQSIDHTTFSSLRLRPRFSLVIPRTSTVRGSKRIQVLGVKYFNRLPTELMKLITSKHFLKEVKAFLNQQSNIEQLLDFKTWAWISDTELQGSTKPRDRWLKIS